MGWSRETVKLRDAVKGRTTISYEKKEELRGMKCAGCEQVFNMEIWCNDQRAPGLLTGTFDEAPNGNGFSCYVCSFKCAHDVFTGGWKKLKEYKEFVKCKAKLARVELGLTNIFKDEAQMIEEWESQPNLKHNEYKMPRTARGSGEQGKFDRFIEALGEVIQRHK